LDESKFLRCITEDSRRSILKFLGNEEKCVCEIVEFIAKEQSVVSHHLALLRRCGIVTSRQDGKRVLYKIINPELTEFLLRGERLAEIIVEEKGEGE
jgi:ArsR family transcriptional regulator